jgi:hypothetical protein
MSERGLVVLTLFLHGGRRRGYPEKDRLLSGTLGGIDIHYILVGRQTMETLVVYDSLYGKAKAIAQAVGDALPGEVEVLHLLDGTLAAATQYATRRRACHTWD